MRGQIDVKDKKIR